MNNILSTRDIQDVSLEIMKKLHVFMDEHHLRYSLYGGSLIGAIRHKGFIPWDDDMDIAMPQPDYERFLSEWKDSDELKLFTPELRNSNMLFARICERKQTSSYERVPWKNEDAGVWVDIFPITAVPEDLSEHQKHIDKMKKFGSVAYYMRYSECRPSMFSSLRDKVLAVFKMLTFRWINKEKVLSSAYQTEFRMYDWDTTKYVGEVAFLDYPDREHLPKEWWDDFIVTDFEDTQFMIVKHYDDVLKNYYGDYMQLPPEESRFPLHAAGQWFYWKNKKTI